jgi:hypothetical protein
MKYITLFEAFKSESISKISSFLKNKINKDQYNKFINSLKYVGSQYDLPISSIKEDDVEYLSKKKAIKVNPKGYNNDITAIKFWFSIEKGYLGYTGIGNYSVGNNKSLSSSEIYFLRETRGIKTGELSPVLDYSKLKTGDLVIGYFSDRDSLSSLAKATIYISNDRIFAIQDVSDGGSPDYHDNDWRRFGNYSWSLGTKTNISNDHINLNHYKESDRDLGYYTDTLEVEIDQDNYLYFNLPISGNRLVNWNNSNIYHDVIDGADFAIILHIKKILERGYKKRSYIESERQEIKSGSHKFMSDDDFRKINIEKYISGIISNMGLEKDKTINDIKDLQKIVFLVLCDDNALYTLYNDEPEVSWIDRISRKIKDVFYSKNEDDIKYYLSELKKLYNRLYQTKQSLKVNLVKNKKLISESSNPKIREISSKVDEINKKIYDYFKIKKINSISDLKMVMYKLRSISSLLSDEDTKLVEFRRVFSNIFYESDISSLLSTYEDEEYKKDELDEDINRINKIKEYVDSILN